MCLKNIFACSMLSFAGSLFACGIVLYVNPFFLLFLE